MKKDKNKYENYSFKQKNNGKQLIKTVNEKPPYPGAKPHFLIEDNIDNKEWLCNIFRITDKELPQPKQKN